MRRRSVTEPRSGSDRVDAITLERNKTSFFAVVGSPDLPGRYRSSVPLLIGIFQIGGNRTSMTKGKYIDFFHSSDNDAANLAYTRSTSPNLQTVESAIRSCRRSVATQVGSLRSSVWLKGASNKNCLAQIPSSRAPKRTVSHQRIPIISTSGTVH